MNTIPPPPRLPNLLPFVRVRMIIPHKVRSPYWMALKVLVLLTSFGVLGACGALDHWQGWCLIAVGFGLRHLLTEK